MNVYEKVIDLAEEVFNTLGYGFPERTYHNAMEIQLRLSNIQYETERNIDVLFKNHRVGFIRADLIVDHTIVVELKSCSKIREEHVDQCKRYMRLLGIDKGLVINFPEKRGDSIEIVDVVLKTDS